jgi:DHA1 family bicyclomycin/chloramphenicol resistance-like MFS transporter
MSVVTHPGDLLSRQHRLRYVIILGALTALGPFTIDLYLPAFPEVAAALRVTPTAIQATLAATTIGLAIGQLIVGPWSDVVGRRMPLIVATFAHVAASLACAAAPNVELLTVSRFVMGAAAAAGGVVSLALVRDLFSGVPMMRMLSRLGMINGLAPIVAPILGSQLLRWMDWRGIFVVLAIYGAVICVASALWITETLPSESRIRSGVRALPGRMGGLLRDRRYLGLALIGGFVWGGEFSYLAGSPFLFQGVYAFSVAQYGLLFSVNALGYVLGTQLGGRLSARVPPQWILAVGTSVLVASGAFLCAGAVLTGGLLAVVIPLWFSVAAVGVCIPCVTGLALAPHGAEAGTAASLLGAMNFTVAGLVTPLVGLIATPDALGMGTVMLGCAVVASASLWLLVRPRSVPALTR